MQILPIADLTVFDVAILKSRDVRTTFSLNIDGINIYSMSIQGTRTVSSGKNTVGAFRDNKRDSLFAWIDPVSNEFLQTSSFGVFHPILLLPPLMLIVAGIAKIFIGIPEIFPLVPILIISTLIVALIAVKLKRKGDREIEEQLRSALKEKLTMSVTEVKS
jgi:hypothetical protein